jgi:hypothetical protein
VNIADRLKSRPVVGSLVVPYMVHVSDRVDFRVLDVQHVDQCAQKDLCGVCGLRIRPGKDRAVFLGPARELECFDVPWMHEDCADYVIEHCPFVSGRHREYREPDADPRIKALTDPYRGAWMRLTARSWRAHREGKSWHFQPKVVTRREVIE